MALRIEVERFLAEFYVKYHIFDILFVERKHPKNVQTSAYLDLSTFQKKKIIESLEVSNYSEGPVDDVLYKIADMWIFGYQYKNNEIYIKISLGTANSNVICISFHISQYAMNYPFK